MRVLLATPSPADYMAPPLLGDEQIVCGPAFRDARAPDGRIQSLVTPAGEYNLAAVAARLPADQQPDVVVCLVDASWRNQPRNLAAFRCPRILLVADTHHMSSPLIGMLRYAASEPFDRIVFLYDRHHLAFFRSAGLKTLHWLPGLTFPHEDTAVKAVRQLARLPQIAFVGQAGNIHPRRARLLAALGAARVPVSARPLRQREALAHYGASLSAFNASLNGDLNLRVFETLASGTALLTDALAPASGLARLLMAGRELVTYADESELVARARHLVSRPAEAHAIGLAGARWFDENFSADRRRAAFRALAFDGVDQPLFADDSAEPHRVFFSGQSTPLVPALAVYEGVQELHRTRESVSVAITADCPADLSALWSTLPRVRVAPAPASSDLTIASVATLPSLDLAAVNRLWIHDAAPGTTLPVDPVAAGLSRASQVLALFCRPETVPVPASPAPAADVATELLSQARAAFARGDHPQALHLSRRLVERDARHPDALAIIAELALVGGDPVLAHRLASQALARRPGDPALQSLLARIPQPALAS